MASSRKDIVDSSIDARGKMSPSQKMANERPFAASQALLVYNPWPGIRDIPSCQNEMFKAVDDLAESLRNVCGALCTHSVDPSLETFQRTWDSFAHDCKEKKTKVVFVYICSHAATDSGELKLLLKNDNVLSGLDLVTKIEELHNMIPDKKVILFLECCYAGALVKKPSSNSRPKAIGSSLQLSFNHPFKAKVEKDQNSGTLWFMSCGKEELSTPCIFASSIVKILEKNKKHVTAETLVKGVKEMVKLWSRNLTSGSLQNPTSKYIPESIEGIGHIGGCGEEELMEVDPPCPKKAKLDSSNQLIQDYWTEGTYKKKCEKVKGLLEDLRTGLSMALRSLLDDVIAMYEDVEALETRIVFCGESGCGKSTLINAVLAHEILPCSGGPSGCTSTVIEMRENKNQNNFKAVVSILERSEWNDEAERLRKTLTTEKCNEGEQAKEILEKVYGSSNEQNLPKDVERLFQQGSIQIEKENHEDLRKELSRYISHEKEYWPIIEKVEIFVPNCNILQGGIVLVDIPGFVDPIPVRKVIVEKEYKSAKNVFVCAGTARFGLNETFQKIVQDYNENLRGLKEVTFVLTKSDEDMKNPGSYVEDLQNSTEDYEYLNDLKKKVKENKYLRRDFQIECAKHRNRERRAALERKIKEHMEDGSCKRPVHSVCALDFMCLNNLIDDDDPFFRTKDETGVPELIKSLKRIAEYHVILNFERFRLRCQKLPAELETSLNTSLVTANIESDVLTALEELKKHADETDKLCKSLFQEMKNDLKKALENDFKAARADGVCTDWKKLHHGTLKAALVRRGEYTPPKKKSINLNANLLENTVTVLTGKCAELVTKVKQHISDFFEKKFDTFVEFVREKHPQRKPALHIIEESRNFKEEDVCESLDNFLRILKSETLKEMSTSLESLYSQLDQQNDYGPRAQNTFVTMALHDMTKEKLKGFINRSVKRKQHTCTLEGMEIVELARQQMSTSLYDESEAAKSNDEKSIRNFKKQLDLIFRK